MRTLLLALAVLAVAAVLTGCGKGYQPAPVPPPPPTSPQAAQPAKSAPAPSPAPQSGMNASMSAMGGAIGMAPPDAAVSGQKTPVAGTPAGQAPPVPATPPSVPPAGRRGQINRHVNRHVTVTDMTKPAATEEKTTSAPEPTLSMPMNIIPPELARDRDREWDRILQYKEVKFKGDFRDLGVVLASARKLARDYGSVIDRTKLSSGEVAGISAAVSFDEAGQLTVWLLDSGKDKDLEDIRAVVTKMIGKNAKTVTIKRVRSPVVTFSDGDRKFEVYEYAFNREGELVFVNKWSLFPPYKYPY